MKKILFAASFLLTLVFITACDNEEIVTEFVKQRHDLSVGVNPQGMYDQFGISTSVREDFLRGGDAQIAILTFVYDSEGKKVSEKKDYISNFNPVRNTFKALVEGKYTIVAIETLVDPDNDYQADTWSIEDTDQLTTLKVKEKTYFSDGEEWSYVAQVHEAVGVATIEVNVGANLPIQEVTPKALGSAVHFHSYNMDVAPVVAIGWATDDVLSYYLVNPMLSKDNRYVKNLTRQNKTHPRMMFDYDENTELYYAAYVMEPSMDWRIAYKLPETPSGKVGLTSLLTKKLEDGATYHIGCYYNASTDILTYNIFDNLSNLNTWKTNLDNSSGSAPSSNLYKIPYTNWNVGTVSAVKSAMSGLTLVEDIALQDNGTYRMTYGDVVDDNVILYWYDFKYSSTGLTDSYVILNADNFTISQVRQELVNEGYSYISSQDNDTYFYGNSTTTIMVDKLGSYIYINYYDSNAYSARDAFAVHQYVQSVIREKDIAIPQHSLHNANICPANTDYSTKKIFK